MGQEYFAYLHALLIVSGWRHDRPCEIWVTADGKWVQVHEGNHRLAALRHFGEWGFEVPVVEIPWES